MKINHIIKLFLLSALFAFVTTHAHAAGWKLAKNKNGVKVYTKSVPNKPLKVFRGETVIKAKLTDIYYLFDNAAAYKLWLADVSTSKSVKKPSNMEQYVYIVQKAPIIKDRDAIVRGKISQNKSTKVMTVTLSAAPKMLKENSKYVRIKKMNGKFVFTPIGDGKLKVTYELDADPGGSIPAIAANQFAIDMPYKSLVGLKRISKNISKYRVSKGKSPIIDAK